MAYNLRYYNEFISQHYQKLVRVEILERDYSGNSERIKMGASIHLSDSGDGREQPIKKLTASLRLLSERNFQFEHLFTADDKKYQVIIKRGGVTVFIGFLESDSYSEPYYSWKNYTVNLTARDNLGRLEDIDYLNSDGDRYEGLDTAWIILQRALLKTGITIPVDDNGLQIKSDSMGVGNTLIQSYLNNDAFWNFEDNKPRSCLYVVEEILKGFGAQIRQVDGKWFIVEQGKYYDRPTVQGNSASFPTYLKDKLNFPLVEKAFKWINKDAEMVIQPAWKSFIIDQDYNYNTHIFPFPSNDELYTPTSSILATIENWTQEIDVYYTKNAGFFAIPPKQAVDPSRYIYRELNVKSTADTVLLKFKFGLANRARLLDPIPSLVSESGKDCDLYFDIINISNSGDQILTPSGWVAYTNQERELSFSDVNTGEITILVDGIPNDGKFRIVFWNNSDGKFTTPGGGILTWGIAYEDITLTFDTGTKSIELKAEINESNNVKEDYEINIGQVKNVPNSDIIYLNGIFDQNGASHTNWKRPGDTTERNLLEVVGIGYDLMNRQPSRQVTGTVLWDYDIWTNIDDQNKRLMINSIDDWNMNTDQMTAEFIEVFEYKNTLGAFDDGYDDGFDNSDLNDYKTNSTFTLTEKTK